MSYQRGDVVWGPDPFKSGENPRPWLILNNDRHPFGSEEYLTVTLTTTPHEEGIPLDDDDWVKRDAPAELRIAVDGGIAEARCDRSSARTARESFVQTVVSALNTYLEPPKE